MPYLGPAGLDVTIPMKREGVFTLRLCRTEIVSYCIFSIAHSSWYFFGRLCTDNLYYIRTQVTTCCFRQMRLGVHIVHNDVSGMLIIFSLHISSSLFRCGSPKPTECPRRSNSACIASGHTLNMKYVWQYGAIGSKDHRGQLTCLVGWIIFMHCDNMHCDKRDANLFVCLSHSKRWEGEEW